MAAKPFKLSVRNSELNLPPVKNREFLRLEIKFQVPRDMWEDAAQEAWTEFLAGRDPMRAVLRFGKGERRYRKRFLTNLLDVDGEFIDEQEDE